MVDDLDLKQEDPEAVIKAKQLLQPAVEKMKDEGIDVLSAAAALLDMSAQMLVLSSGTLYSVYLLNMACAELAIKGPMLEEVLGEGTDWTMH